MANKRPLLKAGRNIAMKVPADRYDPTVTFYRDVIGLPVLDVQPNSTVFRFGSCRLWIDRTEGVHEPQVWLEVRAGDTSAAAAYLQEQGVTRRDDAEELPAGFDGFWIANPAGVVHLVSAEGDEEN